MLFNLSRSILFPVLILLISFGCKPDQTASNDLAPLPDPSEDYETNPYPWGFINARGEQVIAPAFDEVRPFKNGLALVRKNGRWGYIDKNGKLKIAANFRAAWPFHEGLARAKNDQNLFGYINPQGEWAIPPQWSEATDFSNEMACVRVDENYGFINRQGQLKIAIDFDRPGRFQQGYAIVKRQQKYGMIDKEGQFFLPLSFNKLKPFAERLARAQEDKLYGFLDLEGQWHIPAQYDRATDFQDGFATVSQNGKWGVIDPKGNWQIPCVHGRIRYLGENRWVTEGEEGKFELRDEQGQVIPSPPFDEIHSFFDGLAVFSQGEFWSYLRPDGTAIVTPQFYLAWPFKDGLARVATRNGLTFIDQEGFQQIRPNRNLIEIRDFSEGLAAAQWYQ